jgi:hypothetical protein
MTTIIPVIHYADDNQAMRNAERAIEAGCAGVMLIEMRGQNAGLLFIGGAIKRRWPAAHVGINHLGAEFEQAAHQNIGAALDSTWTDDQLTYSSAPIDPGAIRISRALESAPPHAVFCAVAFKYQADEADPADAAAKAVSLGFIPTTSGPATGVAANPARIERMRELIGPKAPLALASGITPDNAQAFAPLLSHMLVATGVSASFHEFDPARLRALVEAVRS